MILLGEFVTLTEQVDESDGNGAIDVQNEIGSLGRCHLLHFKRVVEQRMFRKVLSDEFFDDCDSGIGILDGLNAVADPHDVLVLLLHVINEVSRAQIGVESGGKLFGGIVQGPSESWSLSTKRSVN